MGGGRGSGQPGGMFVAFDDGSLQGAVGREQGWENKEGEGGKRKEKDGNH